MEEPNGKKQEELLEVEGYDDVQKGTKEGYERVLNGSQV